MSAISARDQRNCSTTISGSCKSQWRRKRASLLTYPVDHHTPRMGDRPRRGCRGCGLPGSPYRTWLGHKFAALTLRQSLIDQIAETVGLFGAPGTIRTSDPQIRSLMPKKPTTGRRRIETGNHTWSRMVTQIPGRNHIVSAKVGTLCHGGTGFRSESLVNPRGRGRFGKSEVSSSSSAAAPRNSNVT